MISLLSDAVALLSQWQRYFADLYSIPTFDLWIWTSAVAAAFLLGHGLRNFLVFRWRRKLPLVVGGWGSRGKSGTERLKAALCYSIGLRVVSKTTGCESVFLYGEFGSPLVEVPLYRPGDKVSIWEHTFTMHMAAAKGVDIFLWECMGLNPDYVRILQRRWSRDDLSTITNTYPDHEDIQGPTGLDVAETIANFIPQKAEVITTERLMAPVLCREAAKNGSVIECVQPCDVDLFPADILQRYPYAEHPNNIALVAALGQKWGYDEDFTYRETSDHVVPDVGVLKVFPEIDCGGKSVQFSNGFSANEKLGFMGNWHRLGFASAPLSASTGGEWLVLLVNNREDRATRARIFAQFIAHDICLDHIVLVGTGIDEFCKAFAKTSRMIGREMWRLLGPGGAENELRRRLRLGSDSLIALDSSGERWAEYFRSKVLAIDQLAQKSPLKCMHMIVDKAPDNTKIRIMGTQNIKGFGLAWLQMWQRWENDGVRNLDLGMSLAREMDLRWDQSGTMMPKTPFKASPVQLIFDSMKIRRAYRKFIRGQISALNLANKLSASGPPPVFSKADQSQ